MKLPKGVKANEDTVKIMCKITSKCASHKSVRQLARYILNQANTKSHHHLDEAVAIGAFVQRHVRYMKDPYKGELLQTPDLMIKNIKDGSCRGDCDDMALLTACLLFSIGIEPIFRTVRYKNNSGPYNHIYVVCYEANYKQPKQRIALDCIIKDRPMGMELPHASGREWKVKA